MHAPTRRPPAEGAALSWGRSHWRRAGASPQALLPSAADGQQIRRASVGADVLCCRAQQEQNAAVC
eukprot:828294-Pleurochrysis_carterae.AAC.4